VLRFMRIPLVSIAGIVLASCTLGRDYRRPAIETPSTYRSASAQSSTASLADLQWFELFRDDTLTGLVKTALQENFELRIAAQRVL
jgi:outer membrane protein TolC